MTIPIISSLGKWYENISSDPLKGREGVNPIFVFKCGASVYTQPMGIHLSGRILKLMLACHEIHTRINGFMTNINAHSMAYGLSRHLRQCKHLSHRFKSTLNSSGFIFVRKEMYSYCQCYFYLVVRNCLFNLKCELHNTLLFRFFIFALFLQMSRFWCG